MNGVRAQLHTSNKRLGLQKHIHLKKERQNLPFNMSFTSKFGSNEYLAINSVVFDMVSEHANTHDFHSQTGTNFVNWEKNAFLKFIN